MRLSQDFARSIVFRCFTIWMWLGRFLATPVLLGGSFVVPPKSHSALLQEHITRRHAVGCFPSMLCKMLTKVHRGIPINISYTPIYTRLWFTV